MDAGRPSCGRDGDHLADLPEAEAGGLGVLEVAQPMERVRSAGAVPVRLSLRRGERRDHPVVPNGPRREAPRQFADFHVPPPCPSSALEGVPSVLGIAVNVSVLHVKDSPNLERLVEEMHELLRDRTDVTLSVVPVHSDEEAAGLGFHGSPTVLTDGVDPFPAAAEPVGLSCRQYPCCRDSAGRVLGFATGERPAEALGINGGRGAAPMSPSAK